MVCMADERRFSIWTILAPLALIASFMVAVVLVRGALETPTPAAEQPLQTLTTTTTAATTVDPSVPLTYRIRKGDTLSAIAERYGITTASIELLNPELNPMALTIREEIRLR